MKTVKKHKNLVLDRLTYATGIALPLLTIPQAYTILIDKQVEGVSLLTWSFYLLASVLFAVFGIIHKEKLLIITYVPFVAVEALIVAGLIIY